VAGENSLFIDMSIVWLALSFLDSILPIKKNLAQMKYSFFIVFIISFWLSSCQQNQPGLIYPIELKCEYSVDPLGVETQHPRLSWILGAEARNQMQTAYEVLVASDSSLLLQDIGDIWSSGIQKTDQSIHVKVKGKELISGEKYYWKVRVWDKHSNPSPWSYIATWTMGLIDQEDWKGEWIGYECEAAPLFRKEFNISKNIERATAFISGLGYYEMRINGEKTGDHVLDPGQTDYELRTFYVVHDITENIKRGSNAIGVELGNGFYDQTSVKGGFGWHDAVYGDPRFIVQLEIRFNDGTDTLIVSDTTWKVLAGPTIFNNVYVGDFYDARLEQNGWDIPGFDDSNWYNPYIMNSPGGRLISQKLPAIKRMKTLKPIDIFNPRPGVYVFDMGQNFAGWARLKIEVKRGTKITLRFAEEITDDHEINPASCGGYATKVIQTDKYICKGGGQPEIWEPHFTYHGFRYVEMTGFPGIPKLENLEGVVVYSSLTKMGEFDCSDTMINKIHNAALWTLTSNLHSIITDCPHREKCGWLGDQLAEVLIYNLDAPLLIAKFERDIETSRISKKPSSNANDGLPGNLEGGIDFTGIPWDVAPGRRVGGHRPDWGSTFIHLPWFLYLYYNDISLAKEHWKGMNHFMNHLGRISKNNIIYQGYGDMFSPGRIWSENPPVALTSTAWYYFNAIAMAEMAQVLGRAEKSANYKNLAEKIKNSFNSQFYNSIKKDYGSQTASAMALQFNLIPNGDETAVVENLVDDIMDNHKGHFSTGHMGSRFLYDQLSRYGCGNVAIRILDQTSYPSMGYLFSRGATTFWESWGEEEIDRNSAGVRSRNHPFQAGMDAWFFKGIGGIKPDPEHPGFKEFILKPEVLGILKSGKASYQSIYGYINSDWKIKDGKFYWSVSVPVNTKARIFLPVTDIKSVTESGNPVDNIENIEFLYSNKDHSVFQIGSGDYFFEINNFY
jgi:alpha-L-rhamnosidase